MGNSQSNGIGIYKIMEKHLSLNNSHCKDYITFDLDKDVFYNNGNKMKRIYCICSYPFKNWKEGDLLVIDNNETKKHNQNHDFDDINTVIQ